MRVSDYCADCLWKRQQRRSDDRDYLDEIRRIIDSRAENDCAPYLVYLFNRAYERRFGKLSSYGAVKKQYNDLVLSMETEIRRDIEAAPDPLAAAIAYARTGNYIDFGAMNHVDDDTLLSLLKKTALTDRDMPAYRSLAEKCKTAESFLLLADNCGEIVLDKLLLEQLGRRFPQLSFTVMVRGAEVLNDVTEEDAVYVGIDKLARIITNGTSVAGTIYDMLPVSSKEVFDSADIIFSKGQGNHESLSGIDRHIYYALLCKCELFTERFGVPELTGIFVESVG